MPENQIGKDQIAGRKTKMRKSKKLSLIYSIGIFIGVLIILAVILDSIEIVDYKNYQDREYGVSMDYPAYWNKIEHPGENAVVVFTAPLQSEMSTFAANVNITTQQVGRAMTKDIYARTAMQQIVGTFKELVQVVENETVYMAGRGGHKFVIEGRVEGEDNPVKYMFVWFLVEKQAYILTYAALQDEFKENLSIVNHMFNSFKIL